MPQRHFGQDWLVYLRQPQSATARKNRAVPHCRIIPPAQVTWGPPKAEIRLANTDLMPTSTSLTAAKGFRPQRPARPDRQRRPPPFTAGVGLITGRIQGLDRGLKKRTANPQASVLFYQFFFSRPLADP